MRRLSMLACAVALTVLTGCGSSGIGDLGGILGGSGTQQPSPTTTQTTALRGSVNNIDTQAQRIDLNAAYVNNLRNSTSNQSQTVYYDSRTRVSFQGNNYAVTDLERGDEVEIATYSNQGRLMADTITVTRNVRQ
ncbi:MAG: hypothetical protein ABI837_17660 [Acidobacteriota bacterium]